MLEPMLFDPEVPKTHGAGSKAHGFLVLRHSLFLSCVQDIANLTLDDSKRTPSIKNLFASLQDQTVCASLRQKFSIWKSSSVETATDSEIIEALRRMELREQDELGVQFDEVLSRARSDWLRFSAEPYLKGFSTIRDKVISHTEVVFLADKYQFVDIATLGITWSDLRTAISTMQSLVEDLGLLIRGAGFAWDVLDEQLAIASKAFWAVRSAV